MTEYTIPLKNKWTPFKQCEECKKKKLSTTLYNVYDNGLNDICVEIYCCKKCMKEAEIRARNECYILSESCLEKDWNDDKN